MTNNARMPLHPRAGHPRVIIEQLQRRYDLEQSAFTYIEATVLCALVVLFALIACWRRRDTRDESLGSILLVPSLLDAIFGGNRRDQVLHPHRYWPMLVSMT